jgi:catalase-peroxidase
MTQCRNLAASDLVFTAFSAAATYRNSDKRGGANGGRLALAPQNSWTVNRRTVPVITTLRGVLEEFNGKQPANKKVSLADLIVLGGCAAVEKAASDAGVQVSVPFTPGRRDTTQELTDIEMFDWLKPVVDGFRNYIDDQFAEIAQGVAPEELFLDKAQLLALTAPEWVALVGGLRAMGANYDGSASGIFTDRVGVLTNDFFTVLTSMEYDWKKDDEAGMKFSLNDRATGKPRFKATRSDLIFGSNSQLRAVAEVYSSSDGHARFVRDFVKVWDKVMMLDRFDIRI